MAYALVTFGPNRFTRTAFRGIEAAEKIGEKESEFVRFAGASTIRIVECPDFQAACEADISDSSLRVVRSL
jgi:hypothetical protein